VLVGREVRRRESVQREVDERNRELTRAYIELDRTRLEQVTAKDQILSHVSHELRTPLNAIYQFATILQDGIPGDLNEEQDEYLAIVVRNVVQLQRQIGDVLEATRAQGGSLTFEPESLDVGEVASDLVRVMRSRAGEKNLRITTNTADGTPPVHADPARVRQVLTNLLDNAIKFTPHDGTIAVEVGPHPTDRDYVLAAVRDTGPGIEPDAARRVFDRLYQANGAGDASRKGLGLGLFICREIITAMGGNLWLESTVGSGSTFSFTLPAYATNPGHRG
jgi:signal transduction histidine kinase